MKSAEHTQPEGQSEHARNLSRLPGFRDDQLAFQLALMLGERLSSEEESTDNVSEQSGDESDQSRSFLHTLFSFLKR